MARISVQDCLDRIPNRFAVVLLAARRMRQLLKGSDPLVECKNGDAVTALREIAAGKVGLKNAEAILGKNAIQRQQQLAAASTTSEYLAREEKRHGS